MSEIKIRRAHNLPLDEARQLAEQVAADLRERFALDCAWRGHALEFSRDGVEGKLVVAAKEIHLEARLDFLFSFLKPTIEEEIEAQLEALFAQAARRRRRRS
jgi:putative polyhydroxyalkanoate system protein